MGVDGEGGSVRDMEEVRPWCSYVEAACDGGGVHTNYVDGADPCSWTKGAELRRKSPWVASATTQ